MKPCFSAQRVYMRSKHLRPVLALGATGTGVDFEIGIELVGLAAQQRFKLTTRDPPS